MAVTTLRDVEAIKRLVQKIKEGPAALATERAPSLASPVDGVPSAAIEEVRKIYHQAYVSWIETWIVPYLEELLPRRDISRRKR